MSWRRSLENKLKFFCLTDRRTLWALAGPILPIPLLFVDMGDTKVSNCAYASVWMGIYWISEPIPIAATAFLPLLLFPLLSVLPASEVSRSYFNDTIFLLTASMMFAAGLEKWKLHRKLALRFLLLVGSRPKVLMLGFMLMTGILSMWISNTATTAMMTPLAIAVLEHIELEIKSGNKSSTYTYADKLNPNTDVSLVQLDPDVESPRDEAEQLIPDASIEQLRQFHNYSIGLLLGVCYSSSLGGTGTLIGTGSNLVLTSQLKSLFPNAPEISFGKWFIMAAPLAIIVILITWVIIVFKYAFKTSFKVDPSVLQKYYDELGPLSFPQIVLMIDFIAMALLWFTRTSFDGKAGGWSVIFAHNYVSDGTVCILGVLILFIIPSRVDNKNIFNIDVIKDNPWDIVMLLAGGVGLATGIEQSGLAKLLSDKLTFVSELPLYALLVVICLVIVFMTEFTSNVSTITVFSPILAAVAVGIGQNPLLLMIPGTLSSSYAFMLPIATPPNAIVFSSGRMKVIDMVTTGGILNVLGLFLIPAFMMLFAGFFEIEFGKLPSWANNTLPN